MATSDSPFDDALKPGQALGFFMTGALFLGLGILIIHIILPPDHALTIDKSNRLTAVAAWLALVGTIGTAKVAVTNMVRQHTINTLLQSRLSSVFMENGVAVNEGVAAHQADGGKLGPPHMYVNRENLRYMLNYYEYVALGIRVGDLAEDVLKGMMCGIIIGMCNKFSIYINDVRRSNPYAYEHLIWLKTKWEAERANDSNSKTVK